MKTVLWWCSCTNQSILTVSNRHDRYVVICLDSGPTFPGPGSGVSSYLTPSQQPPITCRGKAPADLGHQALQLLGSLISAVLGSSRQTPPYFKRLYAYCSGHILSLPLGWCPQMRGPPPTCKLSTLWWPTNLVPCEAKLRLPVQPSFRSSWMT